MLTRRNLLRLIVPALALLLSAASAADDADVGLDPLASRYELGQGWRLGDSGFTLGGYGVASSGETAGEADWRTAIDALSALLWWDGGGRWHFFSETELEDALVAEPGRTTTDEADVVLERLYVDYTPSDALKLRVGKFLTPVGRWNLVHAAPLVWTTSRPLITTATFPTNATGLMLYGLSTVSGRTLEYSLYGSPGIELAPNPDLDTFEEALGGRLNLTLRPELQLGASIVSFEQRRAADEHKTLYSADFLWSHRRHEVSAEYALRVRELSTEHRDERGAYLQWVAPLTQRLYGVLRFESFRESGAPRDLSLFLAGVNFRPRPALALKAEISHALETDVEVDDGFRASFAVLF